MMVVIHIAKHDATMQPVISMRQALCEHLLLPCGVCNSSGCVTACHNWRKSFVAIVFRIIGLLCSVAWLLPAHDRGPCSLFFVGGSGVTAERSPRACSVAAPCSAF